MHRLISDHSVMTVSGVLACLPPLTTESPTTHPTVLSNILSLYIRMHAAVVLLTGVRLHPPGRTDKYLCRCFGAPACRVFLIT